MDTVVGLEKAIATILDLTNPVRIVLFGSRSRIDYSNDSDIDLFVIVPDNVQCKQLLHAIRNRLINPLISYDVFMYTESEFRKKRLEGWRLFEELERDGKIIYAA
jgi:predicted nucleotidyltransferase